MKPFIISTESTADLPESYIQEHQIVEHPLYYILDNITYGQDVPFLDPSDFYTLIKEGARPTTSASNPKAIIDRLKPYAADGYDILHIAFSSGLSSTFQNTQLAAAELSDSFPESKMIVIDSLAASAGQGLMVHKAVSMKESGSSIDEIAAYLQKNRLHFVHSFTVDDLFHLYRGGRLSKTTAIIGSTLKIKPLLHVNDEGRLVNIGKIRNRQKVLQIMAQNMEANMKGYDQDVIFISHSNCYADAQYLADQIRKLYAIENIVITNICPTIGAHTGTGCIALFYMGEER